MYAPLLLTKLYVPPPRPGIVSRPRQIERLNESLQCKLALISASAGFGKTTLVSEWVANCGRPVAWLSLDEGDNDSTRFLTYLISALQMVAPEMGAGVLSVLQAPKPPPVEAILITLLNEIAAIRDSFILVLDDYHLIDSEPIDRALTFLLEHLPPQMHLVIVTREDPPLPLARLRARGQLTELRTADLRFTLEEATKFLNQVMGLTLSPQDIAALEARTEGWIAGLQLAALSMQGHPDTSRFIQSFTGSHHFILDYLMEEVLQQQSESVQAFLLRTAILDRLCGPLCEAVLGSPSASGQKTLEYLERANLFTVSMDNERRWYRYHHLFGNLLCQRLGQNFTPEEIAELHIRASEWYEKNDQVFEAFQYATVANDVERAERLMECTEMPLHFSGAAMAAMNWLASLPAAVLNARPQLWVRSATLALVAGQTSGVEEKLQAAEIALQNRELDARTRDLIGQVACARATLALTRYEPDAMLTQARRALEYLSPENLTYRYTANWALASASLLLGDRAAAARACLEGISISQKSGDVFSIILAATNLGRVREFENQLYQAAETYQRALQLSGEHPHPNAGEVHLGLARIHYQWNELDAAEQHGLQSLQLTRQFDQVIDRFILSEVFLAQLKLAQGAVSDAQSGLAQTEQTARRKNFLLRMPDIAAVKVLVLLRQGDLAAASQLAHQFDLPLSHARVFIAQGNLPEALDILGQYRQRMEARGWADERLRAIVLQTVALHLQGEQAQSMQLLGEALALAEPGGFIRLFVDEGAPMAQLMFAAAGLGLMPGYTAKLLAAFEAGAEDKCSSLGERLAPAMLGPLSSVEPLSPRELDVLRLIAEGLTNQQIGERLFLALDTVKGYNRRIFEKLQVQRRTEAIARARELGLL